MTSRFWLCSGLIVALSAACGKSGSGDGGGGKKGGTNAPLATAFRCFDLTGGMRSSLTLMPDGKRVAYLESRHDAEGNPAYDLSAIDLATGKVQPVAQDVNQVDWIGDQPVFLRATERTGKWYEWKRQLFVNGKPVSQAGEEVVRYVIDRATGTVYYATYKFNREEKERAKQVQHVLYKVAPGSTTPEKIRDGVAPHAIVDGGKALLVVVSSDEKNPLAKLPLAGGEPTILVPGGVFDDMVVGDKVVFMPRVEKAEDAQLMVMPLAGGPATPLPGSTKATRLLSREQPLVIESPKEGPLQATISKTDGAAALAPIATVAGVAIDSAVLLPDGVTLAAAVVHDTNDSGKPDGSDEADICLIPASATPIKPETRTVPKRLVAVWPQIEAKAKELGGKPRYIDNEGSIAIGVEADGDGPATLDEMAKRARDAATAISAAAKDPNIGLAVRWKTNGRTAAMIWNPELKKLVARVGAYGLVVTTKEDFALSAVPGYTQKVVYIAKLPYETECKGTVTNL